MTRHFAERNAFNALRPTARQMPVLSSVRYFFFPDAKPGCHPAVFWLGAAAMVLIFCFLGFLVSRLPLCSPLAMSLSSGSSTLTGCQCRIDGVARSAAPNSRVQVIAGSACPDIGGGA
jgi:hypothetical protein